MNMMLVYEFLLLLVQDRSWLGTYYADLVGLILALHFKFDLSLYLSKGEFEVRYSHDMNANPFLILKGLILELLESTKLFRRTCNKIQNGGEI